MKMNNLMIIQYCQASEFNKLNDKPKACHYLTLKTSLIDYYTNKVAKTDIPKSFEELKSNTIHHGWIKKILPTGILVELPYNLTGLCTYEHLNYADELKSSNLNGLNIGQSMLVKVLNLYEDKKRFTVTAKTRHDLISKFPTDVTFMMEFFNSFLTNTKRIFELFSTQKTEKDQNAPPLSLLTNKQFWEKLSSKIKIGSVVQVAVKNFNKSSGQIECLFVNDLEENNFDSNSNMIGYAFANPDDTEEDVKNYKQGCKLEALVLGFDPVAKAFCLTINKKSIKSYSKNFDPKFRSQIVCKQDQSIKAEILYVSQWFCIVGLKAHALGRLAFMPLFKNDFTQLNTFRALNDQSESSIQNKFDQIDKKIRQKQVLEVSSASLGLVALNSVSEAQSDNLKEEASAKKSNKENKRFSYYYVGEVIKVLVKQENSLETDGMDYLIVLNDAQDKKLSKKQILRQLAILNENHVKGESEISNKRKADDKDEPVIVKKKLVLNGEKNKRKSKEEDESDKEEGDKDHIEVVSNVKKSKAESESSKEEQVTSGFEFPWEVTDFDQFNDIINKTSITPSKAKEDETKKKDKSKKDNKKNVVDDRLIYENEERVFDANREPENSDDYERLIASKPNSSLLWIKYMVFYLQMAEIDKARNVAQQALKTILYSEDQERLNVWVALLNLENMYGTQINIEQTFNKATQNCDSFKIHCQMAEIFARSSKLQV